jgi:hypothetical protein
LVDSLKVLDPEGPIREADIPLQGRDFRFLTPNEVPAVLSTSLDECLAFLKLGPFGRRYWRSVREWC